LLIEVWGLFWIIEDLESKQSHIEALIEYIGDIDMTISILSLRAGESKTCEPKLVNKSKTVTMKGAYHPLIEHCVSNDIHIDGKSVLITGSNMSGKSTFLRTFLINSILAQTIYTCFADEFISPPLRQFSSIRIDDNLFQGKSYYFQEVSTIATFLEASELTYQNLFVLDEVFKGTNTIERIASAKAILSYLNKGDNIVLVSTHDIELADLLQNEYDLYHFAESVDNNELNFDHLLKPGPLTTRNAIRILELANYPSEVIQEAKKVSNELTKRV
jgi:DNA mismatch repair ATPase MutS